MARLEFILIFVLLFEGISGDEDTYLYHKPGDEAILRCGRASPSDRGCSMVDWCYDRDPSEAVVEVQEGKVKDSARAARLSLDTTCSLIITNITAEDAGHYSCQQKDKRNINVILSIMTILPSPPDADPKRDGKVTLECSLLRYRDLGPCRQNSLRWVDETGTVLLGERFGNEFNGQLMNCFSVLTVKRQSGHNRRYTCQLVDERNKVQMKAEYTPDFTGDTKSNTDSSQVYIIIGAVGGGVLLVIITAVLIKVRKRDTGTEDVPISVNPPERQDESEGGLTYVTVNHANQKTTSKKKVKVEAVTYSTVKTPVMKDADDDSSRIYSCVSEYK